MENKGGSEPQSYYSVLGVSKSSSDEEIRRAYRKLAMQWHPDKWTKSPSSIGVAKRKFQEIQEAYSVLSDRKNRTMYDAGLYNPDEEEDEGFADFLQEIMSLMANVRKENRSYSLEDLQGMLWEMAQGFEFPEWSDFPQQSSYQSPQKCCSPLTFDDSRTPKRARWDANTLEGSSHLHILGLDMYGAGRFCR